MKYYNTPYKELMTMAAHRFFLFIDEIESIESPDKQKKSSAKTLDSEKDFKDFFFS